MATVHAVYQDGVFKPTGPVPLPEACEVEFEPRVVSAPAALPSAWRPNDQLSAEEWVAEWRVWTGSMPTRPVTLDDSRDSIYGDRG